MPKILDWNGVEITLGCSVIVHQDDGDRVARVVDISNPIPTLNQPGYWVDIDDGRGWEGMMSYILQVQIEGAG